MHERSSDNEVIIANYDHTIRSCVRSAESIIPSWSERVSGSTPSLHVSSAGISYTAVSSSHNNSTYYSAQSRTHSSIVASSNISAALRRKQESTHGIVQASIIANSEASVTRFQNQIPVPSVAHTEPVQLFIKGLTKTSLGFMFSSYTLVDEVLAFLAVRTGVPPHSVFLTYSGKVLELGRILDDYDVRKDSTLFANLRVRGNENEDGDDYSQIRIKTPMGTVINWYGNVGSLNSTVRDVKNYVERKEGIPSDEQRLCFAGGHLEDYRTLRDIMSQSPLRLLLRLQSVKEMDESSEGETPESTPAQLIRIFKPPYAVFNPQLVPMRMRNIRLLAAVRRLRTS
ncbi:hypothetical protein EV356DRAFT_442320 [Viridothelium virens]|uniref:Ubiquitin-like domain-containing protein n=1 Tax=Viridothelium virens TaxID=1048519 RepID=A0A6A6HGX0_VIRVR|nr:hypothetical protein EV356DRAFT_442320 [Viridothelium virens]